MIKGAFSFFSSFSLNLLLNLHLIGVTFLPLSLRGFYSNMSLCTRKFSRSVVVHFSHCIVVCALLCSGWSVVVLIFLTSDKLTIVDFILLKGFLISDVVATTLFIASTMGLNQPCNCWSLIFYFIYNGIRNETECSQSSYTWPNLSFLSLSLYFKTCWFLLLTVISSESTLTSELLFFFGFFFLFL